MTLRDWARPPAVALGLAIACAAASWPGAAAAQAVAADGEPWPSSERIAPFAAWVAAAGDSQGLPFAIVDKQTAQVAVYDAEGAPLGLAPALLGSAVGDGSAPGVGERPLAAIPPDERTTPAGRFFGGYGLAPDGRPVLWVDYENAISLHPVVDTNRAERRPERLLSPTPKDNRITFGCINVAAGFYEDVVRATFEAGGVFYVLPETTPLEETFPAFAAAGDVPSAKAAGF